MMDSAFFSALLTGDRATLDDLLTEDFVLVDVVAGGVVRRADLLAVIASRDMVFEALEVVGTPAVRTYAERLAISVGETRMSGRFNGERWAAHSRFTHVFVRDGDGAPWLLASAQGTPIANG